MGRILASVTVANFNSPEEGFRCDAAVETSIPYLTLPTAWKERLGELEEVRTVEVEIAEQKTEKAIIYGPVRAQIEGFRPIFTEVLFIDMEPEDGFYEPLIGYLPLEQSQAAVDMLGHRLLHVKHVDLK